MATLILTILMVSSSFLVFSTPRVTNVNASAASLAQNVTAEYGDPLQYEWPQWYGSEHWDEFSAGPGQVSPDLLWRVRALGASSGRYYPAAFNGKVFIYSGNRLIAFNWLTGAIDWAYNYTLSGPITGTVPPGQGVSTGMPYKIDNDHMIAGRVCVNPNTGAMYWYTTWKISRAVNVTFSTSGGWGGGAGYSSTEKLFFVGGRAWDFSDPSHEPTILWDISGTLIGGEDFDSYGPNANGEGVVMVKSGTIIRGIKARTGEVLWSTQTTGGFSSYRGMYYEGAFYKGLVDDSFVAVNATTGEYIWRFDEKIDYSNFACGSAAAYGMVYMTSGAGIMYAFNAKTGDIVWKYQGNGWNMYQGHPIVADGKVYQTCPDNGGRDPYTGQTWFAEYVCLDALTGKLLWKLKGISPCGAGGESHLLAYGNLYMVSESGYLRCYSNANSDWPMFRRDPAHSAVGPSGPSYLSLRWRYKTEGQVCSSPSIVDDKVYFGSWDTNLYCLNAYSGDLIWKFPTGTVIGWSPAIVGGRVYTGCSDGYVYCIDADAGTEIWRKAVGPNLPQNLTVGHDATLASSPMVVGNRLYVGSVDSKLYCLDTANGNIVWSFETVPGKKERITTPLKSTPTIVGGYVYTVGSYPGAVWSPFGAPTQNWTLYKLDAANGDLLMSKNTTYGGSSAPTTYSIFSSPLVVGDRLFIADQNRYWYCFNTTTFQQIWRYTQTQTTLILNSAVYFNGRLIFTDGFFTTCVDAATGTLVWREFMKREVYNSATVTGNLGTARDDWNVKIYSSNNDNFVHVLNGSITTGYPLNETRKISWYTTDSMIVSSTSVYKGMSYIGCRDWYIYCFEEANTNSPVQLSIKLNVNRTQVNKTNSESVTASGTVFPSFTFPLKVTFVKPDGSRIDEDATFDIHAGTFTASYTPDVVGKWSVVAWVAGDPIKAIADSYSNPIDLNVIQYTPPEQPPPEPTTTTIPIEYILAAVAIIVIIVVIAVAYMMMRRRKK